MVFFSREHFFTLLLLFNIPVTVSATRLRQRRDLSARRIWDDSKLLSKTYSDVNGNTLPPLDTPYYFDQLIDHQNPDLGTFKVQYFHSWEYYEPGGPIIIALGGEDDLTPTSAVALLTNVTISGAIAAQEKGAVISLEHRFFGQSQPFKDLTEESLKYLTIQQSIDDLEYFAKNVVLAMPGGDDVKPDKNPWILVGGSYSGALTAWTMTNKPGLFWAGYASSAVVQPLIDFWQYFEPAREYMPPSCAADLVRAVAYIDEVFQSDNVTAIDFLKTSFGYPGLGDDDFITAISAPLSEWQSLYAGDTTGAFFDFCDMLEYEQGQTAPDEGWGLEHTLTAWTTNTSAIAKSECGETVPCYNTSDPAIYDVSGVLHNDEADDTRSWTWMYCNEMGWFQVGPPPSETGPHIMSSALRIDSFQTYCALTFPNTFTLSSLPRVNETTEAYHGWDIQVDRVFFANGHRDPWREVTMSASHLNVTSTELMPIEIGDGYHCSDMDMQSAIVPSIALVQKHALTSFSSWMKDWRSLNNSDQNTTTLYGGISSDVSEAPSDDKTLSSQDLKTLLRNSYIGIGVSGLIVLLVLGLLIVIVLKPRQKSGYKPILAANSY